MALPQTFTEIKQYVSDRINRGSTFDTLIEESMEMAIRRLERGRNWYYMRSTGTWLTIGTVITLPLEVPTATVPKAIQDLHYFDSDGDIVHLDQIEQSQFLKAEDPLTAYYVSQRTKFTFVLVGNHDANTVYNGNYLLWKYTNFDNATENWLTQVCPDLVIAETMLELTGPLRFSDDLIQRWTLRRDEAVATALQDDAEAEAMNRDDIMGYFVEE